MKKVRKVVVLALCAVLLVAGSVMGTLAYLTSTASVENTFTVGNVSIDLKEYVVDPQTGDKDTSKTPVKKLENLELVPGREIEKNPFITVDTNSEPCWLVVKIENGLGTAVEINGISTKWHSVTDKPGYYLYEEIVDPETKIDVFTSVTCDADLTATELESLKNAKIVVTAYAIQAEGVTYENVISSLGSLLS